METVDPETSVWRERDHDAGVYSEGNPSDDEMQQSPTVDPAPRGADSQTEMAGPTAEDRAYDFAKALAQPRSEIRRSPSGGIVVTQEPGREPTLEEINRFVSHNVRDPDVSFSAENLKRMQALITCLLKTKSRSGPLKALRNSRWPIT